MSTVIEWQERLDQEFPDGANVIQVADVPENTLDSTSMLTPRLYVREVDGDVPTIRCWAATFDKDLTFTAAKLEDWPGGYLVTQSDPEDPKFLVTRNFAPGIAEAMKPLRDVQGMPK